MRVNRGYSTEKHFQNQMYHLILTEETPPGATALLRRCRARLEEVLRSRGRRQLGGVAALVERFDRGGTEPFEPFRSEFGQNSWNPNSFKIQKFSQEN